MKIKILFTLLFSLSILSANAGEDVYNTFEVSTIYNQLNGPSRPAYDVFQKGINGFKKLKMEGKIPNNKNIISIIDFRLASSEKRMWIIDINSLEVLHHTYVAHGKNTGVKYAKKFSNTPESLQSSLGFYVTAESYYGKHGLSLRLDGQENGFNNNARKRAVVLHSADYASPGFVQSQGRLGRSFGCPAIPPKDHKKIVNLIKEGNCLFIYYPDENYLGQSKYVSDKLG